MGFGLETEGFEKAGDRAGIRHNREGNMEGNQTRLEALLGVA